MDKNNLIKRIKKEVSLYPDNMANLTEDETENNRFFDGENEDGEEDGELHGVVSFTPNGAEMDNGDFWRYEEFSENELVNILDFFGVEI